MIRNPYIAFLFIGTFVVWALSNDHVMDAFGTLIAIAMMILIVLLTAFITWIWWNVRVGDPETDSLNDSARKELSLGK